MSSGQCKYKPSGANIQSPQSLYSRCARAAVEMRKDALEEVNAKPDDELIRLVRRHFQRSGLKRVLKDYHGDVMRLCEDYFPGRPDIREVAVQLCCRNI